MNPTRDAAALIGRVLLVALYLMSGWGKITGFQGTTAYIASAGLPMPAVGTVVAIVVELGLGILVLIGWKARWSALVIAVFTLVAAFVFHAYWASPPDQQMGNYLNFWKNVSIAGGFLMVYAFGPGRYSVERDTTA